MSADTNSFPRVTKPVPGAQIKTASPVTSEEPAPGDIPPEPPVAEPSTPQTQPTDPTLITVSGTTEQRDIEVITAEIQTYKRQTGEGIYEIGKRLVEVKAQLEHGQWLDWLRDDRINFSERTAHRFMRVAKGYPNPTTLANLGLSKALALLTLPEEERDTFTAQGHQVNGAEKHIAEMSCREVEKAVRDRTGKQTKQSSAAKESEEQSDSGAAQGQENSDPVTVLMGGILHLEKVANSILETLSKKTDNQDDYDELYIRLRKILNETLEKLPPIELPNRGLPA